MIIRPAGLNDARALADLFTALDNESRFMLFEPGERKLTEESQRKKLESIQKNARQTMLVAVDTEDQPVGVVAGLGGQARRNRHSLYCAIGVLARARDKGVGRALMQSLMAWAQQHQFTRIDLTVMTHNQRAVHLYTSLGFEIEGTKRQTLKVDGRYVDEYIMARLLEPTN